MKYNISNFMNKNIVGEYLQIVKNNTEKLIESNLNLIEDQLNRIYIFNEFGLIGGICALFALVIASHQIIMHLYYFNNPKFQLYIVRILLMVPVNKYFKIYKIYSVQSWLSLIFPKYSQILNTIRDCYEAYVLYIFLQLLIQYLNGEDKLIYNIEQEYVYFILIKGRVG